MGDYRSPLEDQWGQYDIEDDHSSYVNAGLGETDVPATSGTTEEWVSLSNITDIDGSSTYISSSGGSYVFPYLRASTYGFDIPDTATILGVEVLFTWGNTHSDYTNDELRLAWGTDAETLSTDNLAEELSTGGPEAGDTDVVGGATEMWGETTTTLTPAVINSEDFGVVYKPAKTDTSSNKVRVDAISMAVYYSVTEDGSIRVTQSEEYALYTYSQDPRVTQVYAEAIISTTAKGAGGEGRRQTIVVT